MRTTASLGLLLMVAACGAASPPAAGDTKVKPSEFPTAHRPVAAIVSDRWSNEEERDRLREAGTVMDYSGVRKGMTVADIGAGEGYYTIRLAQRVGPDGRVLAEDILPAVRDKLAERVTREALDMVSVKLGTPADPKLPENSFDRVFLVHMYHEIASPYEFLWHLRPSLRAGGRVVVVDADRPTQNHGTPPALLDCEFAAVGYVRVERRPMPSAGGYLAMYEARGARPEPAAIKACEG
ncbi:class I SAM-dependent methyltransferase [Sphingomonas prati]|uniref:Ubiquinone/menaquinone biosynthesis C-methylase UbiE n=1 Tax=Sphingomonas prati TaxID=1843237 RepID=A0A7W9F2C6_9SPHN|nr:methyltransferase domain-containing protein [Sphingomonas prati]MBB5730382.1 ubiquinone/menaquinone biosynthesis C-methylase UbiE [Sphingomonas prati]GGE93664.1 methyltransferase type 11 [Sphingomonas prati]